MPVIQSAVRVESRHLKRLNPQKTNSARNKKKPDKKSDFILAERQRLAPCSHRFVLVRRCLTDVLPSVSRPSRTLFSRVHYLLTFNKRKAPTSGAFLLLAERQRFELWEGSLPRRFSRPLH